MSTDQKPAPSSTRSTKAGTTGTARTAPPKPPASRATKTDAAQPGTKRADAAHPSPTQAPDQTTTERAEETFDAMGQRIGIFALAARDHLARLSARAREEAEDMWAEAQHLRGRK